MTPSPVISLDRVRKQRRTRRVRPFVRRALLSIAIGVSLLGIVVIVGATARVITPRSVVSLLGALAVATAVGWPLSAMLSRKLVAAHESTVGTRSVPPSGLDPRRVAPPARKGFSPNPIHPSSTSPEPPTRRRG